MRPGEALRGRGVRARALLAALALAGAAAAAPAAAQEVDQTCVLALTEFDPGITNAAFPDQAASYWNGGFVAVPGTRVRITGEFPHARYMSWNVYDSGARPVDGLADVRIWPDAGSSNPFLAGADRDAGPRTYTVFVEYGPKPADPAPNTIYTGGPPNIGSALTYRVYIPDRGLDRTGGVGLPRVTVEPAGGTPGAAPVDCRRAAKPSGSGVNEAYGALSPPPEADAGTSGYPTPRWRKFVNLPVSVADNAFGNPTGEPVRQELEGVPLSEVGGQGGYFSNLDNAYVYAAISRGWGRVLVLTGRSPAFPDTFPGPPTMPTGQLRYWSLCQNEPHSQRFVACLADHQVALDAAGRYTIAISTAAERPANARPECGVSWIPWGPSSRATLILRHMLPDPGFAEAIQRTEYGREQQTMGDYLPTGTYLPTKQAFEARGCAP